MAESACRRSLQRLNRPLSTKAIACSAAAARNSSKRPASPVKPPGFHANAVLRVLRPTPSNSLLEGSRSRANALTGKVKELADGILYAFGAARMAHELKWDPSSFQRRDRVLGSNCLPVLNPDRVQFVVMAIDQVRRSDVPDGWPESGGNGVTPC